MSESLTYSEVSSHSSKNDLYVVIHDKIYNASSFIDEHPGGEEVMLDVAGQDATEAFEDVGHSDEAREILNGLKIGDLKRQEGDPKPNVTTTTQSTTPQASTSTDSGSSGMLIVFIMGALLAVAVWYVMQKGAK